MRLNHRCIDVQRIAHAASWTSEVEQWVGAVRLDVLACRLLAHQLALRTRAQSWLLALPVALSLLAHGSAVSLWCTASSTALGWCAHSLALGAVIRLA